MSEDNNLNVADCDEIQEVTMEDPEPDKITEVASEESTTSSSNSSATTSSSNIDNEEPPVKRRRKRKRHPKKRKSTPAVESEEPFTARYKKLELFIKTADPKVHLRFDEEGNADDKKSEYNYKARVIKALTRNLELNESGKEDANVKGELKQIIQMIEPDVIHDEISLKPRIIKAIGY